MQSFDLPEMMEAVNDVVRYYAQMWSEFTQPAIAAAGSEPEENASSVNEVLYSLMNAQDRLAELSKLVGSLRFAVEGNDRQTGAELEDEIKVLGRFLPEHYYVPSLLQAVMDSAARAPNWPSFTWTGVTSSLTAMKPQQMHWQRRSKSWRPPRSHLRRPVTRRAEPPRLAPLQDVASSPARRRTGCIYPT